MNPFSPTIDLRAEQAAKQAKWREENPDKHREYQKKWYAKRKQERLELLRKSNDLPGQINELRERIERLEVVLSDRTKAQPLTQEPQPAPKSTGFNPAFLNK